MTEWLFTIDKFESEKKAALAIRLVQADTLQPIPWTSIKPLARSHDLQTLDFLSKEDAVVRKNAPASDKSLLFVSYQQTTAALKLLASTGKLSFNGKRVVCDLFGRAGLYYEVDVDSSGKPKVTGKIQSHGQDFTVQDCDFVCGGPPVWFIKGISLKFIGTHVSWHIFKELAQGPIDAGFLSGMDSEEHDSDDPRIVYKGNAKELLTQSKDPLPVLCLKDRTGAFADLWMDYGEEKLVPFREASFSAPSTRIKRQRESEKLWEKDLLETGFILKPMATSSYYCPLDKVAGSLCFLLEIGWTIKDWKGNRLIHPNSAELTMESQQNILEVRGRIRFGEHTLQVSEVVGAFTKRERFVEIAPGMTGLIPPTLEPLGLSGLEDGVCEGTGVRFKRSQIGSLTELFASDKMKAPADLLALKEKLSNFAGITQAVPGASFQGTLRPYQQEGLNWLNFLHEYGFHGILADDMGLGKTIQVLALFSRLPAEEPILIIVPTSLLFNWKKEIEKFLPGISIYVHHGSERDKQSLDKKAAIILTSYTTLRLDAGLFGRQSFACIVLDEAHTIKNPQTQIAQTIFSLHGKFRLSITGTPIENHLTELWSQFHFLMPDLLGQEKDFSSEVQASGADSRYLQRIRKQIKPFILRRTKEEVAKDLPEMIEQTIWIEMTASQQAIYDQFLAGLKGNLLKKVESEGVGKHRMEILEALLRLRQICCHPLLVSQHMEEDNVYESAKLEALFLDMENIIEENRKVLVYSQFTSMLHLLAKRMRERKWEFAYLDGQTVEREKEVAKFQGNTETKIFLISLKAGGVGLNLTAADTVILYDPWWNEAVEKQAIARAHRIGQKDTVFAKRYIVQGSIEEKMMKLKTAKQNLIEDVLNMEESLVKMTEADFAYLFS